MLDISQADGRPIRDRSPFVLIELVDVSQADETLSEIGLLCPDMIDLTDRWLREELVESVTKTTHQRSELSYVLLEMGLDELEIAHQRSVLVRVRSFLSF